MPIKHVFERMAEYNRWMNRKVYRAAATLDVTELHADKQAFFGSVFATLNHILVGDTIWLKRFAEHPSGFSALQPALEFDTPASLSQVLHADLEALERARSKIDEMIIRLCCEASEEDFAEPLSYVTTSGQTFSDDFAVLVQHFFNHQTHHRGQITTLLSQAGIDVGATDLTAMIREQMAT